MMRDVAGLSFIAVFYDIPWAQLGTAIFCGSLVGVERQLRGKTAGIRTSILICLGTQVFVYLGAVLSGAQTDPTRVVGQVVTGVGFLGAGVIMAKEGVVKGMTSAAVIWILSAIGAAIGLGFIAFAIVVTLITVLTLIGVEFLEGSFHKLRRGVHHALYKEEGHRSDRFEP